jgi:hypothetical protein
LFVSSVQNNRDAVPGVSHGLLNPRIRAAGFHSLHFDVNAGHASDDVGALGAALVLDAPPGLNAEDLRPSPACLALSPSALRS